MSVLYTESVDSKPNQSTDISMSAMGSQTYKNMTKKLHRVVEDASFHSVEYYTKYNILMYGH